MVSVPSSNGPEDLFGYGGQYRDSESGLIYLRARDDDPVTRQFLNRDPVDQTRPVAYTGGNPLHHGDPTGLCTNPQDCVGEEAAAAGTSEGRGGGTNPNAVTEEVAGVGTLEGVYNSPEAAAIEAADAAQQLRPRPATAGALRVGNRVFSGVNVKTRSAPYSVS
jgi:RHS repeat-associated protein